MPGRLTATPTPSRHPSTRSINASLGNPHRRPPAACDAGLARACGRHAQPAPTAAGARLPRTAEKYPHSGAQPSHLHVASPASTRDSLLRGHLVWLNCLSLVAVTHAVVAQEVAVVPELLDERRGIHGASAG
jgi:hypothetical protein